MSLTVFNQEIALSTTPRTFPHNQRFLDVIGVEELQITFFKKVKSAEMYELAAALSRHIRPQQTCEDPLWLFIFAHGQEGSDHSISIDMTHAFSVFSPAAEGMRHQYFQRDGSVFREVSALDRTVSAIPDLDDIRLLHFASFDLGQLPSRSVILEFKAETWGIEDVLGEDDPSLRVALLLDAKRIAGAPTIGLYGDEVYTALLNDVDGGGNCGNSTSCPQGTAGCREVKPSESAGYVCDDKTNSGDGWISVFERAMELDLVSIEDFDLGLVRMVMTEFLPKYPRGREYISFYYIGSLVLRHDTEAIEEYVRALPQLRKALRELMYGSDDSIVVPTQLRDAMLKIIALQRRVDMPVFQRILSVVQRDLETITGMRKSELLDLLEREEPVGVSTDDGNESY